MSSSNPFSDLSAQSQSNFSDSNSNNNSNNNTNNYNTSQSGYLTIDPSIAGIQPDFNPFEDSGAIDTRSINSSNSYIPLHTMSSSRHRSSKSFSLSSPRPMTDSDDDDDDDDLVAFSGNGSGDGSGNSNSRLIGRNPLNDYDDIDVNDEVYNSHYKYNSNTFWGKLKRNFQTLKHSGSNVSFRSLTGDRNSISLPLNEPHNNNNNNNNANTTNDEPKSREIYPGSSNPNYPSNSISNAKYNAFSFFPIILYEQFKFFFNLYFLLVALSQAIPALRIGYLSSYIVPLAFVLFVTMSKEAIDDIQRRRRDNEQNSETYQVLNAPADVPSKLIKVGDLVKLHKGKRIPADMILLQSSEDSGESFIKTDQLDGETDWKLRLAVPICQRLPLDELSNSIHISAGAPGKSIHSFFGKLTYNNQEVPLTVDNTLWANTVLASGTAIGCVIYTGFDTRQAMNTSRPGVKTGLLELEINSLSKILCLSVFLLSIGLVAVHGFDKQWYVDIMKYLILFSTIIPVSLRVNLDLGKSVYAYQIEHDKTIDETIVRTSTIPEDLGRIEYLLSDKTGTLTQNDMELKKLHLGTVSYAGDSMDIVSDYVKKNSFATDNNPKLKSESKSRRDMGQRVYDLVSTLALCHNVTPSIEDGELTYQAASPDEIAIVKYTETVGLSLFKRDRTSITLMQESNHMPLHYDILQVFPFNSDTKRMGVIVFDKQKNEYWFLEKGADTVMKSIVSHSIWLDEEVSNMAREGLRTLVIARKKISHQIYQTFKNKHHEASLLMSNREQIMQKVVSQYLEYDMELLGLTGVEDKLQKNVKSSIELLRNAGIKIWMLTGDKVETAKCVAISAKLISRGQYVHTITKLNPATHRHNNNALNSIEYLKTNRNSCLLIDGESLGVYLKFYKNEFFDIVIHLPAVIACRCTPQQKADVALLIRELTHKRVCCIGDGGNDVNMIQSADVGVGIVGKEGKQASLAADFSVTQFCHLTKLLLWHGRNSYKRSSKLAQFVIHRGLIISICQVVFSISSNFEPLALYQGWLMVGYATLYTMAPVFSLVLDKDVNENLAYLYPELYKELTEGKSLSWMSFFIWCLVSIYQGSIIQLFAQFFNSVQTSDFLKMVAISFTALILNELIMVAVEINTWNKTMALTEIVTGLIYLISVPFLDEYFDLEYIESVKFVWQCAVIVVVSVGPIWFVKSVYRRLNPPNYAKVQA